MKSKIKIAKSSDLVQVNSGLWHFDYLGFKISIMQTSYEDEPIEYEARIRSCSPKRAKFRKYLWKCNGYRKLYNRKQHRQLVFPLNRLYTNVYDVYLDVKKDIFKWLISGLDIKGPFEDPIMFNHNEHQFNNKDLQITLSFNDKDLQITLGASCPAWERFYFQADHWHVRYKTWEFFIESEHEKMRNNKTTNLISVFCENRPKYKALLSEFGQSDLAPNYSPYYLVLRCFKYDIVLRGSKKRTCTTEVAVTDMEEVVAKLIQAVNSFENSH